MAEANEEQIEIHLDEPEKAKEAEIEIVKAEDVPVKTKPELPPEVRELKFQLEQEKLARAEAEKRARMASEREYVAKNEVTDTNLSLINNAISSTQQETGYLIITYGNGMMPDTFLVKTDGVTGIEIVKSSTPREDAYCANSRAPGRASSLAASIHSSYR